MKAGEVSWLYSCHASPVREVALRLLPLSPSQVLADGTKRRTFSSTTDCIRFLYKEYGLKGFYRGCLANTYRATVGALAMALFDTFQDIIAKRDN